MFRATWRSFLAHKGRLALSLVAVALSVAFVSGTLVFSDTLTRTFDTLFSSTAADVTAAPAAAGSGTGRTANAQPRTVPAEAVARVAAVPGVAAAHGDVSTDRLSVTDPAGDSIGPSGGAPTLGMNWYRTAHAAVRLTSGQAPQAAGQVVVDADTARKHHLAIGGELRLTTPYGTFPARITGVATFTTVNPGAGLFYLDTATAQRELLGGSGRFSQIAVDTAPGADQAQVARAVRRALGAGYDVRTRAQQAADDKSQVGPFLGVLKDAMLGFAGVAVLVGSFLIFNTFSMLVAQRTRQLGLLRALGASRRQVHRSVRAEALLLGVAGSALGVAAGAGLAVGLMRLMSAFGMDLSLAHLSFRWTTPVAGFAVGILVTLLSGWLPARRAGRVSPMAAMRDAGGPAEHRASALRALMGAVLTAGGGAALGAAATGGKAGPAAALLGAGVLLSLLGAVVLGPLLAALVVRVLGAALPLLAGPAGRLAQRNALRNPRRTGATAAALMIGLALVAALSVAGTSMVASAKAAVDSSVGADYVVQPHGGLPITAQVVRAAQGTPGLDHLTQQQEIGARVTTPDGAVDPTGLIASDAAFVKDFRAATDSGSITGVYTAHGISVPRDFAARHHLAVGDRVTVSFDGGRRPAVLPVEAVTAGSEALYRDAFFVGTDTVRRYVPPAAMPADTLLLASAARGADPDTVYAALKQRLHPYPSVLVQNQADYKQSLQDQMSSLLNLVYGLLALAVVVAVLGVVNTLALSVVERTREIGLLRAIGVSRRQLRRIVRLESVLIAVFGALLGLGVGLGWGVVAHRLLALEGLTTLSVPWATLAGVLVGAAVVGLLAALAPAARASRMNVLAAIAAE